MGKRSRHPIEDFIERQQYLHRPGYWPHRFPPFWIGKPFSKRSHRIIHDLLFCVAVLTALLAAVYATLNCASNGLDLQRIGGVALALTALLIALLNWIARLRKRREYDQQTGKQ
jgi:hypothetical protein